MTVFAGTSAHGPGPGFHPHVVVRLPQPTADPVTLTKAAAAILERIDFTQEPRLVRAGVMLTDLTPAGFQPALEGLGEQQDRAHLGTLIAEVTRKTGTGTLGLGYAGLATPPGWQMRRDMLSPRGTTHWDELPIARLGTAPTA